MERSENLDELRRQAINQVKKSERQVQLLMIGVFLWEVLLIGIIILYMDFSDRLHVLIFLSTAIVYGTLGIGLVTLGAYMRQNTLRVISAVELLRAGEE